MSAGSEQAAFLRAIAESPDDDAPRLVFADWLDEHGDPERAEFIRVQVARAVAGQTAGRRERELLARHRGRWVERLALTGVRLGEWERGFPVEVHFENLKRFRTHADAVFSSTPLERVTFGQLIVQSAAQLARLPQLALVRGLDLRDCRIDSNSLLILVRSPLLAGLRFLRVNRRRIPLEAMQAMAQLTHLRHIETDECVINDEGLVAFVERADLPRLKTLIFRRAELEDEGVVALANHSGLPALRHLSLEGNRVDDAGACALANSQYFPRLRDLVLTNNRIGSVGARALLARGGLSSLLLKDNLIGESASVVSETPPPEEASEPLTLSLHLNSIPNDGLAAIATWPGLERVAWLDLGRNHISADGLRALAASPRLANLVTLCLSGSPIPANGMEALLLSPHFRKFQSLKLTAMHVVEPDRPPIAGPVELDNLPALTVWFDHPDSLSESAAEWLAGSVCLARIQQIISLVIQRSATLRTLLGSPYLQGLRSLNVGCVESAVAAVNAIAAASNLRELRWLSLVTPISWGMPIGDDGAIALANAAHLASLSSLDLRGHSIRQAGALAITDSPHLANLECLDLRDNPIPQATADRFRERFGERVLLGE